MWNQSNYNASYWTNTFGQSGGGVVTPPATPGVYTLTMVLDTYEIPVGWLDVYNLSTILDVFEAVVMAIALYTIKVVSLDVFESMFSSPDYYSLKMGTLDTYDAEIG